MLRMLTSRPSSAGGGRGDGDGVRGMISNDSSAASSISNVSKS
jgi:hypothetical protein